LHTGVGNIQVLAKKTFFPCEKSCFCTTWFYIPSLEIYIPRLEMYIPRLEMYIPKLEIYIPSLGI